MAKHKKSFANPAMIEPHIAEEKELVRVIVETPRGSRNKYEFRRDLRLFELCKVLPSGMDFPYDYGFIPSTRADDGDPLDVLLLTDEPTFPGCLVNARLIGAVKGERREVGARVTRNDRLIAVAEKSHLFGKLKSLDELDSSFTTELEEFFRNYHSLDDQKYRILGKCGPPEARKLLRAAEKKAG